MLLSVGGNAAVDFWQRLLEEAGGEDDLKDDEDEDDDEVTGCNRKGRKPFESTGKPLAGQSEKNGKSRIGSGGRVRTVKRGNGRPCL